MRFRVGQTIIIERGLFKGLVGKVTLDKGSGAFEALVIKGPDFDGSKSDYVNRRYYFFNDTANLLADSKPFTDEEYKEIFV